MTPDPAWTISAPHSLTSDEIARTLQSDPQNGLSGDEAQRRLAAVGPNRIADARKRTPWQILLSQFLEFMSLLLAGAGILSAVVGEWIDAGLIFLIVVANGLLGFWQEWQADNAIDSLKKLTVPKARAHRGGQLAEVPAEDLVPGDVIDVKAGDVVPADARLITAVDLEAEESALTGESLPSEKLTESLERKIPIGDRKNMLHMGTAVARGRGVAIVTATAMQTELGQIAHMLESTKAQATPLEERLGKLTRTLAIAVVLIAVAVFVIGILRERSSEWNRDLIGRMLLTAVSLGVAAIPEGLPAVITISLALGAQRMAKRNAIIRKLPAVETLGTIDVICTDKTGTLTQNRMTLSELVPASDTPEARSQLLEAMALCNDAELADGKIVGSGTEAAIVQGAVDQKLDVARIRKERPRVAEIPFSSDRKRMSTLHPSGARWELIVKGASDRILPQCSPSDSQGQSAEDWTRRSEQMAEQGQRVLAFARRAWPEPKFSGSADEVETELEFLGLIGLVDPVRPEAKEAIGRCLAAGITPVMITGDHPGTARSIADSVGILRPGTRVLDGAALDELSQEDLERQVHEIGVYARVSPAHKLRIVQAHQARGRTAAMTGDGVNDAPALKQADIGIAMGITGTDVSREASAMVLADDNFATIVRAIEEGRVVYDNLRKFIAYLLTTNAAEVFVILGALVAGMPMPLLPIHILWINLVTDGLPALALAFEPAEKNTMTRPPRGRNESLFAGGLGRTILVMGFVMALTCFAVFVFALGGLRTSDIAPEVLARGRTLVFTILSMTQLFYVLGMRSLTESVWQRGMLTNPRLIAAVAVGIVLQGAIVYVPFLQRIFHTSHLTLADLGLVALLSAIPLVILEAWKAVRRSGSPGVHSLNGGR